MLGQIWPLLAGVGLLMLGNGLQGTLLGVRAALEGYDTSLVGLLMSGFYLGFMLGAVWIAQAVRKVGHIRVFAALASLASVGILVHATFVDPVTWILMRVLTGFCFSGIFVIAESWLNQSADNASRGQMLATYMVVTFFGMAGGQALMNAASPSSASLFILVSVLISVAAVPMLLSANRAPEPIETRIVGLRRLYRVSPLGTIGVFAAGLINGSLFGMGAVYGQARGMSVSEISILMSAIILGAAVLQWPIGRLSDILDRRTTIAMTSFLAGASALLAVLIVDRSLTEFIAAMALVGGFGLTLHALCLAHTNDFLEPTELVGASSGLVLVLAAGSIAGPLVAGFLIDGIGPAAYLWWLCFIGFAVGLLSLWRMSRREALPQEEQGPYVPVTGQASPVAVQAVEEVHAEEVQVETGEDAGQ